MTAPGPSIHASAVLVGDLGAVLIRGPSGSGKSRLAFDLVLAGRSGVLPSAILVGDDRILAERRDGALLVRPAPELAGLIEIRGLGIRRMAFAAEATVRLVVDLDAGDAERLPQPEALRTTVAGIELPRIPVAKGFLASPLVVAALTTTEGYELIRQMDDCLKVFGNHISPTIATE
jgi:serine kinase of HPr protein (carbohydrate metabolism regulator)